MTDTVSRVLPSSLHIRLSQYCYWCVTFIIIIIWYQVKLWDDLMHAILGLRKPFLNNTFLLLVNFFRKKCAIATAHQQLPDRELWNEHRSWHPWYVFGFVQNFTYIYEYIFIYTDDTNRISQTISLKFGTYVCCRHSSKWGTQNSIHKSLRPVFVDWFSTDFSFNGPKSTYKYMWLAFHVELLIQLLIKIVAYR